MECVVKWAGGDTMTFLAETGSGHLVGMDGAPEAGGRNLAPRPMELMLTGAGVLSALSGRKLLLPFATLGMMLVGAIAGSLLGGFSGMEMLIIASLAVCGVMMFKTENRLLLAVPALAMFHGWAHGVEMSGHSFWLFTSGFMLASTTVLCASFAAGLLLRRHDGLRKTFGGGLIVSALLALMS